MHNLKDILDAISLFILPGIILIILTWALIKKVPIYESFIEGAKDGVKVSGNIIPYLVAIIVAISMFRASGAIDLIANYFSKSLEALKISSDVLPLAIVRGLSGSAALGIFSEITAHHGANSYMAKLSAVMLGSSETTFYVLTVYFGAVGIKKFRYAVLTGITADITGIIASIFISRIFFM